MSLGGIYPKREEQKETVEVVFVNHVSLMDKDASDKLHRKSQFNASFILAQESKILV